MGERENEREIKNEWDIIKGDNEIDRYESEEDE